MKILNKVLVLSALFGSLGFEGVNCADFSTSLKALSKRVAAVNNFNESMVKPGMSFIEKKKIDPYGMVRLNAARRNIVKSAAAKIDEFITAYSSGGTRFTTEQQSAFAMQMKNYRDSSIRAVKALGVETTNVFEMRPKVISAVLAPE